VSAVVCTGLTRIYGTQAALDGVSLTVPDGSFFALLGPSGSGKTTLLRAIAGFVRPNAGTIAIGGEAVDALPAHRRGLGMVFQSYALFPHLTVRDNVAFGLDVRGRAKREVDDRVRDMLALVQLEAYAARKPRQLSGGQQQRVALARALAPGPRVLLLDEPLSALDRKLRQAMQLELKRIQREVGVTTVFVTHDQEEALSLADRVAILDRGRVVQEGPPRALYERPEKLFAATFLGDANILEGRARPDGAVEVAGHPVRAGAALPDPAAALLAVRPEKMRLAAPGTAADGDNRLPAVVRANIFGGAGVTYLLDGPAGPLTVVVQNRGDPVLDEGTAVDVVWSADHTIPVTP